LDKSCGAPHYAEPGTGKNPELFVTPAEQLEFLTRTGFDPVKLAHEEGGITLYAAGRR
jgi:hypothetical protein